MSIYVVTGGAGFIGAHIVAHLGQAGHEVRILDNLTGTGARERAAGLVDMANVRLLEGDIRDEAACHKACAGADFVLHHAAEPSVIRSVDDPGLCAAININGTINVLSAARKAGTVQRFVFASSCAVYGDTPAPAKREDGEVAPITPYATSKLAGEYFCRNFHHLYGLQTVALRYFNVYGPGQDPNGAYAAVIPKFITAVIRGEKPIIFGDGLQSRDFIYAGDIVAANLSAVSAPEAAAGRVFNIGGGRRTTLNDLVEKLEHIVRARIEIDRRDERPGEIKHSLADNSAATAMLNFAPAVTLDEGLARTLHSYRV